MDFVGKGTKLKSQDFKDIAQQLGIEEAAARAVVEVEAAGSGFDSKNRPKILFEPHVFYRELGAGRNRERAISEGIAYRNWGAVPYPRGSDAQYNRLRKAIAIDRDKGLRSASWGMGQIMGFNYKEAGFATVVDFVETMKLSERAQIIAMAAFIAANGLDVHLRNKDWAKFARGYNGAGYRKNKYDTKLAASYARWAGGSGVSDNRTIRSGSRGPLVMELQRILNDIGADLQVDGVFGPATRTEVKEFQVMVGLPDDGIVGPATWSALREHGAPERVEPPRSGTSSPQTGGSAVSGTQHWLQAFIDFIRRLFGRKGD